MKKYDARYVALGHHGDDQVETILMRLVRGSTPKGYAGIAVKRPFHNGYLIRPLLGVTKEEIVDYCNKLNLMPRMIRVIKRKYIQGIDYVNMSFLI